MKNFTRSGDKGTTLISRAGRVPKHSPYVCAIGDIEELQAWINYLKKFGLQEELEKIFDQLSDAVLQLASSRDTKELVKAKDVEDLEYLIETLDESLPPVEVFEPFPGRPEVHIARTVCRRAERTVSALPDANEGSLRYVVPYLNRLNDFLYFYARYYE